MAIFRAGGATDVWHTPMASAHVAGGTIMGSEEANSVTDSYGCVHGFSNLYVAGSGLFPTEGAVNPTYTLLAVALRSVEHMVKDRWDVFRQ